MQKYKSHFLNSDGYETTSSPFGGGKAVLAVPKNFDPSQREGLMSRYGQWLAALNGIFETGADVGTGPADMVLIAQHVPRVYGLPIEQGGAGELGTPTALGVLFGILVCCELIFGSTDLSARTVLVQGVGSVGGALVQMLLDAGCEVKFSDVDAKRIAKFRDELGLAYVESKNSYHERCDVFAPCATGGILNAETIPQLAARIVAGSANNQLETPEDGERLHERGILYAPDFAINAGAVIMDAFLLEGLSHEQARERLHIIPDNLREIFARSKAQNVSPAEAAKRMALERLRQAQAAKK